jgi:hypothetical protein
MRGADIITHNDGLATESEPRRYVLPKNLRNAVEHLSDGELELLYAATPEELKHRGKTPKSVETNLSARPDLTKIQSLTAKLKAADVSWSDECRAVGVQSRHNAVANCPRVRNWQQRPTAREGGLFKRNWFSSLANWVDEDMLQICRAWDLASTQEGTSGDPDYTVGVKTLRGEGIGTIGLARPRSFRSDRLVLFYQPLAQKGAQPRDAMIDQRFCLCTWCGPTWGLAQRGPLKASPTRGGDGISIRSK